MRARVVVAALSFAIKRGGLFSRTLRCGDDVTAVYSTKNNNASSATPRGAGRADRPAPTLVMTHDPRFRHERVATRSPVSQSFHFIHSSRKVKNALTLSRLVSVGLERRIRKAHRES
jgi:hypothetical protein